MHHARNVVRSTAGHQQRCVASVHRDRRRHRYHLALVVGGLSAEMTLKTVKYASTRYLDNLPTSGSASGRAFRDLELEAEVHLREASEPEHAPLHACSASGRVASS